MPVNLDDLWAKREEPLHAPERFLSPEDKSKWKARMEAGMMAAREWSHEVSEHSKALDLKADLFKGSVREIAQALKHSAQDGDRKKGTP